MLFCEPKIGFTGWHFSLLDMTSVGMTPEVLEEIYTGEVHEAGKTVAGYPYKINK